MSRHCRRKNQEALTATLVIPDTKPDIERVLRVISTPEVKRISAICRKVVFTGEVHVLVEYVACDRKNTQPVHFASFKIPFAQFIDHRCAHPGLDAKISVEVEFQEAKQKDRRTITLFLILKAAIRKLDGARIIVNSHICRAEHMVHECEENFCGSQQIIDDDCSCSQSFSCVTCDIDC
ncbi:MAG: DUF3794 domain-containing protein [Negativicutes bacterium]|nr:DUF3794 domain-containing protein [Negativicutes bacterium]